MTDEKEMTHSEAIEWAKYHVKPDEDFVVHQCPCCDNWIAIFIQKDEAPNPQA